MLSEGWTPSGADHHIGDGDMLPGTKAGIFIRFESIHIHFRLNRFPFTESIKKNHRIDFHAQIVSVFLRITDLFMMEL